MPLSEHEQRILDEIERRLSSDDPKFARQVTGTTPYGQALRRLKRAIGGFVCGFALLIVAFVLSDYLVLLGLVAFGVMLASAVVIGTTAKHIGMERAHSTNDVEASGWFARLEERWKKRFDRDDS
jgi:DUF3040 family protein